MPVFPEDFAVAPEQLGFIGNDLGRPECVLATASGTLYVADWRGGVAVIGPDGAQRLITGTGDGPASGVKPNGIALCRDGSFLLAQLDDHEGGVWKLRPDGALSPWLLEVGGVALPPTNFVGVDTADRYWVTVSTRAVPRHPARTPDCDDGFIVLVDDQGARIVADGIGFTNEAKVNPTGAWLYVNETFGRRLSRFPIAASGDLGAKQVICAFGPGVFPDGLDFDEAGGVWITSVFSNRLIRVAQDGGQQLVLEDNDPNYVDGIERDYQSGALARRGPDKVPAKVLENISSIAFGGPDRRTAYLGCLQGARIATFRCPVPGARPPHWDFG